MSILHVLVEALLTIGVVCGALIFFTVSMASIAILIERYGKPYKKDGET